MRALFDIKAMENQYLLLTILMFNFTMEWILGCQTSQIMVMVLMKIALFMMENGMMFHVTKKRFLFVNRHDMVHKIK